MRKKIDEQERKEAAKRMGEREEGRGAELRQICSRSPRIARALESLHPPREDTMAEIGFYVLAPALGSFVQWLLHEALKSGKQRLYFLARDGYFPYRAAQLLCKRRKLPIECRYLSCSRYSLRLPVFHLDKEAALDYICRGGTDSTVEKLLRRAGLTETERREVLQCLSLPFSPEDPASRAELPEIRHRLSKCGVFLAYMEKHSREAMSVLAGYLRQEGLLDSVPDAVVDSGWVGTMQKTLGDVLAYMGRTRPVEGYYWGMYDLPCGIVRESYHTYYFRPEGNLREKIYFNNCLFEAVYTAPHGMTLSYRKEGEQYIPCYGYMGEEQKVFLKKIEGLLLPYIRQLAETENPSIDEEALCKDRKVIRSLFSLFMGRPSAGEAEVFGSLRFSEDVLEGGERPIAAPLTEKELSAQHFFSKILWLSGIRRGKKGKPRESAWYEGSVVRCGKHIRCHLRQYRLYQAVRQLWWILRFRQRSRRERKR